MIGRLLNTRIVVCLSLALVIWLPQVLTEASTEAAHTIDKRNVGVLARTGQLPYQQGKRYVASLARTGNLPVYLEKKLHPGMTNRNQLPQDAQLNDKRYIASLARNSNMPFHFQTNKRDPSGIPDEEDIDRLRALETETKALETVLFLESQLNLELLKEKLMEGVVTPDDEETDEEKRSVSSLARSGALPLKNQEEKRSVEALARAGYLTPTSKTLAARHEHADEDKRSLSALAKNGGVHGEGKRGGIGSLARNNLLPQKKDGENIDELEEMIEELIERDEDKRNLGSVARNYNLPTAGKRNLGALAKGGGYARYAKSIEDELIGNDDKRNVASLARSRMRESKRYLGSLARNQLMPFYSKNDEKRTSPLMSGKSWTQRYYGKRYPYDIDDEETNVGEVAKRYVAALLRQGRLPVGSDEHAEAPEDEGKEAEEKRHIGSVRGTSSISKRSIESQTTDKHGKVVGGRSKRQAGYFMPQANDEYPTGNVQNSEAFDYDDLMEVMSGSNAPEKRFLGRIPQMGPRRQKTAPPQSGRRRPGSQDDGT